MRLSGEPKGLTTMVLFKCGFKYVAHKLCFDLFKKRVNVA